MCESEMENSPGLRRLAECDDILSCISALDEVIAEFDDSISHSSTSSSLTSGASGTPSQKLPSSSIPISIHSQSNQIRRNSSSSGATEDNSTRIIKIMQKDAETVTEIQIRNCQVAPNQHFSPGKVNSSPVKPVRQSKAINNKVNGNAANINNNSSGSTFYHIEPAKNNNRANGNCTSYGILFPKSNNTPPSPQHNNNNNSSTPVTVNFNSGNSYPNIRTIDDKNSSPMQSKVPTSASPHKSIPVTFVVKPQDLERFLDDDQEEDWNYHIEKNLPRSLRKTRKTCFVEDDEEEQQKYCRSPKDFRRNIVINNDAKRSPLLNSHRKQEQAPITSKDKITPVVVSSPTQWLRKEDVNVLLKNESQKNVQHKYKNTPSGSNNNTPLPIDRNLNDHSTEYMNQPPRAFGLTTTTSALVTTDQGQEIDDGYLSMINRHETPILWPEGVIQTETFTPEELNNLNHINEKPRIYNKVQPNAEEKADYFSDDSLEFEPEVQNYGHKYGKAIHPEKISSFILSTPSPAVIQPYINKSSTRKSWSPASEIRIPGKSVINSNTWRKGIVPCFDESQEEMRFQKPKKQPSSPIRKPCAFFIPMNSGNEEVKHQHETKEAFQQPKTTVSPQIESPVKSHLESMATRLTEKVLENGIQEAVCITTLLSSDSVEDLPENKHSPTHDQEFVSVDLQSMEAKREDGATSVNSSLGLSFEDKLSTSGSEKREAETTSSSSGIENEGSTDIHESQYDSLQGAGYNLLEEDEKYEKYTPISNQLLEDIEDLNENPPSFIPPPPKPTPPAPSTPISSRVLKPVKAFSEPDGDKRSITRKLSSESTPVPQHALENPSKYNSGERILRPQRQTSRSHENLLDIDRKEYLPHPCVRRGHSATLPPNAVAPVTGRRPSALRQFFGIFRKSKKQSSVLDLPVNTSPVSGLRYFETPGKYLDDESPQLPEHYSPYKSISNRPSVSESRGSQRSSTSKSSTKRSVLSRIFGRREK